MDVNPGLPSRPASGTSLVIGPDVASQDTSSGSSHSPPGAKHSPTYVGDSNISLPYEVTIGGREFFRKDVASEGRRSGLRNDGGEWKLPGGFPVPRDFDEGSAASRVEAANAARAVKRASSTFDISDPSNTRRNRNSHGLALRIPAQSMHSFAGHSPQSSTTPSPGGGRRLRASPSVASLNATLAEQSPAGAPGSPYSIAGGARSAVGLPGSQESPTWGESSMSSIESGAELGGVRTPGGGIAALSPGMASTHSLTGSQGFDHWNDGLMQRTRQKMRRISQGTLGRFIRSGKRSTHGVSSPAGSTIGSPISAPGMGPTGPFPPPAGPYGYETRTEHGSDAGSGAPSPASTMSVASFTSNAPPVPARSPAPRKNRQRGQPRMVSGLYSARDGGRSEVELSFSVAPGSGHASPTEGSISPSSSIGPYGTGSRNASATHLPQAMSPYLQDNVIEELEEPGTPGKVPTSGGVRYRRPKMLRRMGSSMASPTGSAAAVTTPRMPVSPQSVRTPTAERVQVLPELMPEEEAIPNDKAPRRVPSPAPSRSTQFTGLESIRPSPTNRYTFFDENSGSDCEDEAAQPDVRGSGQSAASVVSIVDDGRRNIRYYNPRIHSYRTSRDISSHDMMESASATPTMAAHGRERAQMTMHLEDQSSPQLYMVERLDDEPSALSQVGHVA
ncbi:hypothetical protein IAT38_005598 [Cryptococcus sp. DSM 104549]